MYAGDIGWAASRVVCGAGGSENSQNDLKMRA